MIREPSLKEKVLAAPLTPKDRGIADWGPPIFVWGIWVLLLTALLAYVDRFGCDIPRDDEWSMMDLLTGTERVTLSRLWEPYLEHRVLLTRLILIVESRLSGCNFHVGMFVNALLLGAAAAILIRCSQRLRGRLSFTDAFFPLVLLHFGRWESLLRAWGVAFILPATLSCILLVIVVRSRDGLSFRAAALFGACLLLMPLASGAGLPFLPLMGLWFAYCGFRLWFSSRSFEGRKQSDPALRRTVWLIAIVDPVIFLMIILYLYHLGTTGGAPLPSDVKSFLVSVFGAFGTQIGRAGGEWWPYSGYALAGLFLGTITALGFFWWNWPEERQRALGLLLFLACIGGLVLGICRARGSATATDRYGDILSPGLCAVYFVWSLPRTKAWGRFLRMGLLTLMCCAIGPNLDLWFGRADCNYTQAFADAVRTGMPPSFLAERYASIDCWSAPGSPDHFLRALLQLRKQEVGIFKSIPLDPEYERITVPLEQPPLLTQDVHWENGITYSLGADPVLAFALESPQWVYGIRFKYSNFKTRPGWEDVEKAHFWVAWKRSDQSNFPETGQDAVVDLSMGEKENTVSIWVNDLIDQFRLRPDDRPFWLQISEIELLVRPVESSP